MKCDIILVMKNKIGLLSGLMPLLFFILTYYSIYTFEVNLWLNHFGYQFYNVIIPAVLFFLGGFLIYKMFKSWQKRNVKKIYLITYFLIIISILLSYFGEYAMRHCSLIVKCSTYNGAVACPPQSPGCMIYLDIFIVIVCLALILSLSSLIYRIFTKYRAKA